MESAIFDVCKMIAFLTLASLLIIVCTFFFRYNQYEHYVSSVKSVIQSTGAVPSNTPYIDNNSNKLIFPGGQQSVNNRYLPKNNNLINKAQIKINRIDKYYNYLFTMTPQKPTSTTPYKNVSRIVPYGRHLIFYVHVHIPFFGNNFSSTSGKTVKKGFDITEPQLVTSNLNNDYSYNDKNINNGNQNSTPYKTLRSELIINYINNDTHKNIETLHFVEPIGTRFSPTIERDLGRNLGSNVNQYFHRILGESFPTSLHIVDERGIPTTDTMPDSGYNDNVNIYLSNKSGNKSNNSHNNHNSSHPHSHKLSFISIHYDGKVIKTLSGTPGNNITTKSNVFNLVNFVFNKHLNSSIPLQKLSTTEFPKKDDTTDIYLSNP